MLHIFLLPLWLLSAFLLYKLAATLLTHRRNASRAQQLGCKPLPSLPSPDPLGITNIVRLIQANNAGRFPDHINERVLALSRAEGRPVFTYQLHLMRNWLLFTCDPKNIQAVLATQFKDFELGPVRFGTFSPLLGRGIFSADGKQWEHSRALLRPQFVREQVSDLELEERHLQNMMLALPVGADGWTDTVDLQPLNFRLTVDSASEFLFGESCNSQLAALPGYSVPTNFGDVDDAAFVQAFEHSQDKIAQAFRLNDWYSLLLTKDYYESCKVCHKYIDHFVQRGLDREKKGPVSGDKEKYHFLDGLTAQTRDPVEIRDQLLSILVAGRDTTASLLGFLWLMLCQHPEAFTKLRAAVINDFGPYNSSKEISFSGLKKCSYLQWCLNEVLRLFPSVPMNSRRSVRDTTLPRGGGPDGMSPIFVPSGTEVSYSVYVMHRNKDIWGPDAEAFIPERWERRKAGFEYLPFNGGPRICLGQQFALTEAGYVMVRLLQRFDKLDGSAMAGLPNDWYLTLTGRPKYGVKVRLHMAADE